MRPQAVLAVGLAGELFFSLATSLAQEKAEATAAGQGTLRVSVDLVLVPVVALGAKDGLPDKTLKRRDFQLFDNGRSADIVSFDSGHGARPVVLWFVVQCRMGGEYDPD